MILFDQFGYPIQVGDKVLYTTGAQSNTTLEIGTVTEIIESSRPNSVPKARIRTASGRTAANYRYKYEIFSLMYLTPLEQVQDQHPELFI